MQRKKNGDGHTYPFREGFRTVIKVKGITFSATGKTEAESKRTALGNLEKVGDLLLFCHVGAAEDERHNG